MEIFSKWDKNPIVACPSMAKLYWVAQLSCVADDSRKTEWY